MSPVFPHGGLRLYLLKLLDEQPRHGYDVIRLLEDRFSGLYAPSAGTIYPRLARLESTGLVEHVETGGRKVYRLTDAGRAELGARTDDLADIEAQVDGSARELAAEIRADVRTSVRDLRAQLRAAAREVRAEQRQDRSGAGSPAVPRPVRSGSPAPAEPRAGLREQLRGELGSFGRDVLATAALHELRPADLDRVRAALREARAAVRAALYDGR